MLDLEEKSGLPIFLEDEVIIPKEGFKLPKPDFRKLEDMKEVIMKGSELTGPKILYSMFRKISKKEYESFFSENKLEYDITVLLSGNIGKEYIKTVGHYHSKKEGTNVYYPEIYEVIEGTAHYVIQKVEDDKVIDVKIIEAKAGDKVIIPPGYGHITINPSNETLVESNIQSTKIVPNYWDVKEEHGECFYETSEGEWVKNDNYENDFEPKIIAAKDISDVFNIQSEKPLYVDFIDSPEKYDFLTKPEEFLEEFGLIS